jgi:hypothetical protein
MIESDVLMEESYDVVVVRLGVVGTSPPLKPMTMGLRFPSSRRNPVQAAFPSELAAERGSPTIQEKPLPISKRRESYWPTFSMIGS